MKKFYVMAVRTNIDGYPEQFTVSWDNEATDDYDEIRFFDTKEEAERWTTSDEAKQWKDCIFEIVEDENPPEQVFLDLVFAYGAEGGLADKWKALWEALSDAKKEVIACAWKDVEVTDRDNNDDDYLPESYEAALSWYDDFIRAEGTFHA